MGREYRVYDNEQKKYVTDEREWLISSKGELFYLDYDLIGCPDCVVEWATGLTDKNGKQIFEGDIVKDFLGNIGEVFYSEHFLDWRIRFYISKRDDLLNNGDFGTEMFSWVRPTTELEVLGNRFDNPDLLSNG